MSQFVEVPIKSLVLQHPLQYARSALDLAKLRTSSISPSLKDKLQNHCSALRLNPRYIEELNIADMVAKMSNIGVEYHATEEENRLWIFAATLGIFLFQFDDYFDKPSNTPENVSRLSMEMRAVQRALSRHSLSGLQGNLDDWPTAVPYREVYHWLLREAEDLRRGAAELLHYTFLDSCFGVEMEITEWAPDVYRHDTSTWNLDRCNEVRKRSGGVHFALNGPLYIVNKWMTKEHFNACNDLLYDAAITTTLANDLLGKKKDLQTESDSISIKTIMIATASEIAQHHNEKVECLRKDILHLDGDTRRLMEEWEVSVAGLFLWQYKSRRYE